VVWISSKDLNLRSFVLISNGLKQDGSHSPLSNWTGFQMVETKWQPAKMLQPFENWTKFSGFQVMEPIQLWDTKLSNFQMGPEFEHPVFGCLLYFTVGI
jgi:hypothetical protein